MKGWGISYRAALGWALGALAVGVLYGLDLAITDVIISPSEMEDFGAEVGALIGALFVVFLLLGGVSELISSIGWRLWRHWPRPWAEMALCAAIWFALTHGLGIDISFDDHGRPAPPMTSPLVFFAQDIAPIAGGLLAPYLYWLIAKPRRA